MESCSHRMVLVGEDFKDHQLPKGCRGQGQLLLDQVPLGSNTSRDGTQLF